MEKSIKDHSRRNGILFIVLLALSLFVLHNITAGDLLGGGDKPPTITTDIIISPIAQEGLIKQGVDTRTLQITDLVCSSKTCTTQIRDEKKVIAKLDIKKCKTVFGVCYKDKDTKELEAERDLKVTQILENKGNPQEPKDKGLLEVVLNAVGIKLR